MRAPPVSDAIANNRRQRLRQLQAERGLRGPVELGRLIGRKTNQTSDLLLGRAAFGERVARSIEECAGLPPGWLDAPAEGAALAALVPIGPKATRLAFSRTGIAAPVLPTVEVPLLAGAPATGGAAWAAPLRLARAWVQQLEAVSSPPVLGLWPVADDAMEPTLAAGDLLLLDAAVRSVSRDGVYALRLAGALQLRRAHVRLDGSIEVSVDHPALRSVDVVAPAALQVAARVLWCWRGRKL